MPSEARVRYNPAYAHLFTDYGPRFEVVMGGSGSGKSYSVGQSIITGSLTDQGVGRKYLCVRKVARTLRHSVFSLLRSITTELGVNPYFAIHKTEMNIQSNRTGAEIVLAGLDDVEKLKSIHGITDVWVEEATELSEDDLTQLNLRLRGPGPQKRIVLTFNPILHTHWIKKAFFDREREDARITITTYKDNAFIDAAYKAQLEALKDVDPYFYQVYALGEWGQLGNQVFSNFVIERFPFGPDDLDSFGGGIDFGFNHPSAIVLAGMRDGEVYVYDELYERGLTNSELVEQAREIDPDHRWHYVADAAEPDRIKEFKQEGFNATPAKKGKGSVKYGIDWLKAHRIHIHADRCPNLASEIQSYHYREDREGNVLDEPVSVNDDAIAALRYWSEPQWTGQQVKGIAWVIA